MAMRFRHLAKNAKEAVDSHCLLGVLSKVTEPHGHGEVKAGGPSLAGSHQMGLSSQFRRQLETNVGMGHLSVPTGQPGKHVSLLPPSVRLTSCTSCWILFDHLWWRRRFLMLPLIGGCLSSPREPKLLVLAPFSDLLVQQILHQRPFSIEL